MRETAIISQLPLPDDSVGGQSDSEPPGSWVKPQDLDTNASIRDQFHPYWLLDNDK